jgi:hypothetical protein
MRGEEEMVKKMAQRVSIYRIIGEFRVVGATWPITFDHVPSTFDCMGDYFFLLPTDSLYR